jgi:hypothetical protein
MLDVYILGDESLLVGRIRGILDLRTATKLIELVEIKEEELQHGFDRVCDLTWKESSSLRRKCSPWQQGVATIILIRSE